MTYETTWPDAAMLIAFLAFAAFFVWRITQ